MAGSRSRKLGGQMMQIGSKKRNKVRWGFWLTCWLSCLGAFATAAGENVVSTFSGAPSNRVDVVFVGDGYQADELDLYHQHLDGVIDYMFFGNDEPFRRYQNFFNFHRIEVVSNESGADVLPEGISVDTALGSRFFFDGATERLLSVNTSAATSVVNRSLDDEIDVDMRFASVNTTRYGGAGGTFATFAGGNDSAFEVALHEIGHSFSNLADEYETFSTPYNGSEPNNVNVTTDPNGAKWERWIGYEQEGIGTIGVYEGGRYHAEGIYRPSLNSKMRSLNQPFDAISREQLILDIYEQVSPLDAHLANGVDLDVAASAWVEVVDPDVIDLTWSIDSQVIDFGEERLPIRQLVEYGILPGEYDLGVDAVDNTPWIRLEDRRPRESLTWQIRYYPGDFDGNEAVDALDIDMLSEALATNNNDLLFDVNGDLSVNELDRDFWVAANQTIYGDVDLSRTVEFADFLLMSANFGDQGVGWAGGDFDGGGVGFSDFLRLSGNFGATSNALSATFTVPEPSNRIGLIGGILTMYLGRRRRRFTA